MQPACAWHTNEQCKAPAGASLLLLLSITPHEVLIPKFLPLHFKTAQKRVRVTTKYQAHDEQQQCQIGDTVLLAPSRPLSKTKKCGS